MTNKHWTMGAILTASVLMMLGGLAAGVTAQSDLEVTEILLGTELEAGVPTSPSTSFSRSDSRIYCMVRLANRTGAEGAIRIAFEQADGEPEAAARGHRYEFPARTRYRTVARTGTQRAAGSYRCVVRTDEGAVLSHQNFELAE